MKVYVHYEGSGGGGGEFTAAFKMEDPAATVADLLALFVKKFQQKHQEPRLNVIDLQLTRQDGRLIPRTRHSALLEDEMEDGSDVTVTVAPAAKVSMPPTTTVKTTTAAVSARPTTKKKTDAPPSSASKGVDPAVSSNVMIYKQVLSTAEVFREKGMFKKACELYRQILEADSRQRGALVGLGKVVLSNQQYQQAWRCFLAAAQGKSESEVVDDEGEEEEEEEAEETGSSDSTSSMLTVTYLLGKTYAALGDHLRAIKWLRRAAREVVAGGKEVKHASSPSEVITKDDVSVASAVSLFELGQAETAADLLNSVIHVNSKHVGAILECARLTYRVGKLEDSLTYLLQAIVIDQKHKGVRQELVRALTLEGGMERLLSAVPPSPAAAAPYAFIATVAKEGGAIAASIALYELAHKLAPQSASYALNLVHVHEIANDYQAAFDRIKAFLSGDPTRRIGALGLRCQDIATLLQDMTDVCTCSLTSSPFTVSWVPGDDAYAEIVPKDAGSQSASACRPLVTESYDAESLDLLALLFTLVKILYLKGGALPLLPSLMHAIEPTRRASKTKLHQTTVRNEHAYYCCIAQLLSLPPERIPPSVGGTKRRPVYVCGDSHSLSPAWVPLDLGGEPCLLTPALVTGLKHWHLRAESDFYPKKNFYNVVASIPPGSDVIFLFGEIDCREGLLMAVEKCRYQTLEEGMERTIGIFIEAALQLFQKHGFKAFIHPIVPVLNETRHIVKTYNRIFHRRVSETGGRLRWLDFFDGLLTEDGKALRPDLELDGTHLHPDYLSLLAPAWEKALLVEEGVGGAKTDGGEAGTA